MKIDKKWMRRWLSLLLVLAMLFGDMQGVVSVFAAEGTDGGTTVSSEALEEPDAEDTDAENPIDIGSAEEEKTEEIPIEPELEEIEEIEEAEAIEDDETDDETDDEMDIEEDIDFYEIAAQMDLETFLSYVDLLENNFARFQELHEQFSQMTSDDEMEIPMEPDDEEQFDLSPEVHSPALDTDEMYRVLNEVQEYWTILCLAYYGNEENIPFLRDEELEEEPAPLAGFQAVLAEDEANRQTQERIEKLLLDIHSALFTPFALDDGEEHKWFNIDTGAHRTSSYHLNPNNSHKRFFIEYFEDYRTSAGVPRVTKIYVLLKAGETLCLGSSILNNKYGKEIEIFDVNDKDRSLATFQNSNTNGSIGYITNRAQEENGPKLAQDDQNNPNKYMPHQYTNNTDKDQTLRVIFYPQSNKKADLGVGGPIEVSKNFLDKQGGSTVAAWDATVVGPKTEGSDEYEVKSGRTWADYLAIDTAGDAANKADLALHVLTKDGYVYKVNMNEIAPFGFVFFANNMGFTRRENGYDYSIYHSFATADAQLKSMDVQGIQLHIPGTEDSAHQKTHYIFFEKPSAEAKAKLSTTPQAISDISNFRFDGIAGGVSQYGSGGDFVFDITGATSVSLRIDFTEMLTQLEEAPNPDSTVTEYKTKYEDGKLKGKGIVELNSTVVNGTNTIYWDGKDINGISLPVGYYVAGNGSSAKIHINAEAKQGEVHFPIIDMEGMNGGITIERQDTNAADRFDVYYNNTPLRRYTLFRTETAGTKVERGTYGKKFYPITGTTYTYESGLAKFFPNGDNDPDLSTLDEETAKHKPRNSSGGVMRFMASGFDGGGNNAGIDIWTYYKPENQTAEIDLTSFAILNHPNTTSVTGHVFYDSNHDGIEAEASGLPNMHVRLVDEQGNPIRHAVMLPVYDEFGNFEWEDGHIKEEEQEVTFEATTDVQGNYNFTGVYIKSDVNYYVQVELDANQCQYMKYVCTTNSKKKYPGVGNISDTYGGDGNSVTWEEVQDASGNKTIVNLNYTVAEGKLYPTFNPEYASPIYKDGTTESYRARTVGYYTAIPAHNQRQLTVKKEWGETGHVTPPVPEVIVELYLNTNDEISTDGSDGQGENQRTGILMDTVTLNHLNDWSYTWKVMDSRQSYFFVEYYNKIKEIHHFDTNSNYDISDTAIDEIDHHVLIAATDSIYDARQSDLNKPYFSSNEIFYDDVSDEHEKETTIDTDALLFDMKYTATKDPTNNSHNIVTLYNAQTYDERAYYLWAGKDAKLPHFVTKTSVSVAQNGQRTPVPHDETLQTEDGKIKGLTVQLYQNGVLQDRDWSEYFKVADDHTTVVVTGLTGEQKPAPGTYTFKCTYAKDVSPKNPETTTGTPPAQEEIESHSWTLSLHIYDVQDGDVFYYSPLSDDVHVLVGDEMNANGELEHKDVLFANDTYRIPLQQDAINPTMGTCADLTGIYATTLTPEEVQQKYPEGNIPFTDINADTNFVYSRDKDEQEAAIDITINVTKSRSEATNREEDHVNYTSLSFKPKKATDKNFEKKPTYVYYRYLVLSETAVHNRAGQGQDPQNTESDSSKGVNMYSYFELRPLASELAGATLSVGSTIDMNFYVDIIDNSVFGGNTGMEQHGIGEYYVDFILDRVESDGLGHIARTQTFDATQNLTMTRPDIFDTSKTDTLYGFTFKDLNAYQMGEIVTARLWMKRPGNTDGEMENILVDERDFSVKQYAQAMLNSSSTSTEMRDMLVDMLNYGTEALHYAIEEDWVDIEISEATEASYWPNSILSENEKNRHYKTNIPETEKWQGGGADADNLDFIGVGLVMEEGMQMSLDLSFRLKDADWKAYTVMLTEPGKAATAIPSDKFVLNPNRLFHIQADGIGPFSWEKRITVQFMDGSSEKYSLDYSVYSYCYDMVNNPNADNRIRNLARAIYQYGKSASAWAISTGTPSWKEDIYGSPTHEATVPTA